MRKTFSMFVSSVFLLLLSVTGAYARLDQGSFYIQQSIGGEWKQKFIEPFTTDYQTKNFAVAPDGKMLKIQLTQKNVSYGDIEFLHLYACGNIIDPLYARDISTGEDVLDDILFDDHNVIVAHERQIEIMWLTSPNCSSDYVMVLKANEYESPKENAFRFPDWNTSHYRYPFQNNGSIQVDGYIDEVDGTIEPHEKPYWKTGTGHPSNNTLLYFRDDSQYVYIMADILLDNTNEFGQDWISIFVKNSTIKSDKEYRVDDYNNDFGKCTFGQTTKVQHKHQSCEIKIPKADIQGNELNFVLRYYGTAGADPSVAIDQLTIANSSDTTPTLTGRARGIDGAGAVTGVTFGIHNNSTDEVVVSNYSGTCTADDGDFDETTEMFSCTPSSALPYNHFVFNIRGVAGGDSGTGSTEFFVIDDAFSTQSNTDGFGDAGNYSVQAFAVFNSKLYAGTYNENTGAEVWEYNGTSWTQSNTDGFGDANNYIIQAMTVFSSKLYAGTYNATTGAEMWEYNGSSWSQSNTNGFGDIDNERVLALHVHNSNLYAGTLNSVDGAELWKFNGTSWSLEDNAGLGNSNNSGIYSMTTFNSSLYVGTRKSNGSQLLTGSGGSWTRANSDGFTTGQSDSEEISSLIVYNGRIYAGVKSPSGSDTGAEIWSSSNGTTWKLHTKGYGNTATTNVSAMHVYRGVLYTDGYNNSTGAEIWTLNTDAVAPSLTLTAVTDPTTDTTPSLSGTATDAVGALVSDVEFQIDSTSGSWTDCTADDGSFNEADESFTCTVVSILTAGSHTMYVRSTDSNSNTTSSSSYSSDTFSVSISASTGSSSTSNSTEDVPQIPQGQHDEIGGIFTPIKDSNTGGQQIIVVVEPGTFNNDAFLSSQHSNPSMTDGVFSSPLSEKLALGILPHSNTIIAGGGTTDPIIGIRQACGIMWQVGQVQQIWYKTYPPKGSDKSPAIIIPSLQSKPSILALKYTMSDLIPPGRPNLLFDPNNFRIAHSIDGAHWAIIPSSVVDTSNQTVAAVHKVGGFYTIVAGCQRQPIEKVPEQEVLGIKDASNDESILKTTPTTAMVSESIKKESPVKIKDSIFKRVTKFFVGLF